MMISMYSINIYIYLVGGFNPSEKYQSDQIIIPTIGENKKGSKPPTRYIQYCLYNIDIVCFSNGYNVYLQCIHFCEMWLIKSNICGQSYQLQRWEYLRYEHETWGYNIVQ